ncbi:MAG: alanine racemase [Bryobacteraceae bacterium]|nr:alanine racemase [Bryobacteraceae bacterium]
MRIEDLDTPAVLIDVDVMERNLARAASYARQHGLRLRPHIKTHKIPALARRQLELGACGITCAKTTEALAMMSCDPPEVLIAYPVVGAAKIARLVELARRTEVTVSLDSVDVAAPIAAAARAAGVEIGVLAEMDAGLRRVGVPPGEPLLDLVLGLRKLDGLRWRGIAFYPGHIKSLDEAGQAQLGSLREALWSTVGLLASRGLKPEIVSGGSTPLLWESHTLPELNEIRPGTYIFNDRNTVLSGACRREDCAATILVTVVSTAPDRIIVDGGSKTFSSDRLASSSEATFGEVLGHPQLRFHKMNEEHGFIALDGAPAPFRPGDRLRIVPNHICVAMNLHERAWGVRNGEVVAEWRVEARGRLQ